MLHINTYEFLVKDLLPSPIWNTNKKGATKNKDYEQIKDRKQGGGIATEDNYLIKQQHVIQTAERLRTYTTSPRKEYLSENITVAWEKSLYFKFRES